MKNRDLIEAYKLKKDCSTIIAENNVKVFLEIIKETLAQGNEVELVGIGKLCVQQTQERVGRNPKTCEQIKIPAGKRITFKIFKGMKRLLS